jgi:hypothetical protein
MMGRFEYKILLGTRKAIEKELNEYAQQGWEPVFFSAAPLSILIITVVAVLLRRPCE